MIACVSTCYREADILDLWINHILGEGIDLILIADKLAPDGSRDILERWAKTGQLEWIDDTEDCHRQSWWTDRLADMAHDRGADFTLPADVDEFPYAVNGDTVAEAITAYDGNKLCMKVWPHKNWDTRFMDHHGLPKVAYRWSPEARVTMGSHDVSIPGGDYGILDMRELKYRSFEHFVQKVTDRNATLEPSARQRHDGSHHLALENNTREELELEWQHICSAQTTVDPIPSHYQNPGSLPHGMDQ
jgi:hypothetical protein